MVVTQLLKMKNLILIGAGDWGLEVWSWLKESRGYGTKFTFKGFLSNNLNELNENTYCDAKIVGMIDNYEVEKNDVFVCTVGNYESKKRITSLFENKGASFINLIHNSVIFFNGQKLGKGIIIAPYCVISNNATISNYVSINLSSTIGHDTIIGEFSVISSQCDLTGRVELEKNVFLGSKVTIAPSKKICANVKVGLGSVIVKNIKIGGLYMGNPAKKIM